MRPYFRKIQRGNSSFERQLIRLIALASVLLVLAQIGLGLARDPVDLYLAMARKVEAPPLEIGSTLGMISPEVKETKGTLPTWKITLQATPAAPVRVLQNGKLLGTLARGELGISAQAGTLQLDGISCPQRIRIQVTGREDGLKEPRLNQSVMVEKNVQTLRISP